VRIALIAMSGFRAHSEELMRVGMTLPGFVERNRVIASMPSLSLLTLAGMTPSAHEVSYHEIADVRATGELPDCDLAAISTYTAQVKEAYELAGRFRERGVATVIGGLHATALPDEAARHVDAVVVGEGELSWPQLLRDAERAKLQPVYRPDGREFDLADAPLPRFDLLDPDRYNRLTVQTTRGCPWRCEFCASSILLTRKVKAKPVDRVTRELRAIKAVWPRPFIELADDNSFANKRHARALVGALAAEDVRWFAETDVSIADDPELLELMRASGCEQVLIGFESPRAEALEGLELRRNWKRSRLAGYAEAVRRIQAHGITVDGCFVLGLDGDTVQDFDAIRRFVELAGLFEVQITVLTPFPGTPLYDRLRAGGRLLDETAWERCTLFDVNFRPDAMSADELQAGLVTLAQELYTGTARRERARRFREQSRGSTRRPPRARRRIRDAA
jgi:radical SAM superfamily enzyme YgiQ (UPF0313 family)